MDSFLLEGTKFLFRVSMGILRMHQQLIIKKKDPFILFQFLKELAKHIFDIENLYQVRYCLFLCCFFIVVFVVVIVFLGVRKV